MRAGAGGDPTFSVQQQLPGAARGSSTHAPTRVAVT
jgi:hypothetical protein